MINIIFNMILIIATFLFITWILCVLWNAIGWNPKILAPFCDNIMGWHIPDESSTFDGLSIHSHCKFCGKEIMQDSQGNWFEVEE